MRRLFFLYAACLCICTIASPLYAQEDNPLDFSEKYRRVGLEIGFSSIWQSGQYVTGCGLFEKGAGFNILIAAAYDQEFGGIFRFEGLAGFQGKSVQSSFKSRDSIGVSTESGPVNAQVDFENIGHANFSYLFLQPSVKIYPISSLYAGVGASVNFLMSASTQFQKNIASRTVNLNELGLSEVFYTSQLSSDPYSMVFPEETDLEAASVTFDGVFYLGAEFRVGKSYENPLDTKPRKKIALSPRIQYTLPFIAALKNGPYELKLNGLQFLIGMRYEF